MPATWISSARPLPSGIRLFRVPAGTKLNGEAGDGIEVIQCRHRYVCAWPSTNPKANGARYRWIQPDGSEADRPPRPEELAELPPAWVEGLSKRAHRPMSTEPGTAFVGTDLDRAVQEVEAAPLGRGNAILNGNAYHLGRLVGAGRLDRTLAEKALVAAAVRRGGETEERARAIVRSGLEAGEAKPANDERLTDVGNARRLVEEHGPRFRYVPAWGTWLVYDARRWRRDTKGEIVEAAKAVGRALWADVAAAAEEGDAHRRKLLAWWAGVSEGAGRIDAMVRLARTTPGMPVDTDELDADPWLFNVANGTVDLRTGQLRAHRREDLITKVAPVIFDPEARCPIWDTFLETVLPDSDVRSFVQEAIGYTLTGTVFEHLLFFNHGSGANGKTTFDQTMLALFGEYGRQADPDLLLARQEAHPTGVADLLGARLVVSTEVDDGRRLAEATVKRLTGGDRLKARYMRQDFFEFQPSHTLWLAANHRPVVRGTDHAIWRRLRLIPFNVTIPADDQDHNLSDKLRKELPGILNWALQGCRRWQEKGISAPTAVMVATDEYRSEMDVLGAFLTECCVVLKDSHVASADLYRNYVAWCEASGERPVSQRKVGLALSERGFERRKTGNERHWHWHGVGLLAHANPRTDATQVSV